MYKFDTKVQHLKYKVLRTVAKHAWEGDLAESILDIPKEIIPGKVPTMRCCVYKERAILAERIKLATGGNRKNPNVIEALDIACDDCPSGGYVITDNCRGCIAHRCEDACPKGAITHDEHHHAHIDKERCINCGRCAEACPYSAILNRRRPCQNACKIGAITMNEDGTVKIDDSKCISCGACVYRCPFGALSDKSFILDAIKLLKEEKHVYAIVAPAIASQFAYAKLGQVVTGIKQLGFYEVVEAALGADMVAYAEAKELAEKGFLTSSCCPAFVSYVHKQFPMLSENVSHNMSPMATIAKFIKGMDNEAKTIFIGPCTAKKGEAQLPGVREYVDCVMTFEELQAMLDSRDIELTELEETDLNNASGFGRSFARCGGLAEAIVAGRDGVSPCLACSPDSKKKIARIMGFTGDIPLSPDLRKVARVACNGCKENAPKLYNYTGIKDCHLVAKYYGGPGKCNFGCLGFGSCVKMCPFHAISMSENGLPVIDYGKCSGCGICARQCPQMVLYITSASTKIHLKCNNRDKGKAAMVDCSVSCISCGMCAKVCPVQAITMREDANGSLPVIDHSKCIECGLCVQKCPRHCLHKLDPITTEHEHGTVATNKKSNCTSCPLGESCGQKQ